MLRTPWLAVSLVLLAVGCESHSPPPIPAELQEPGVRVGLDLVLGWVALEEEAFGRVTAVTLDGERAVVASIYGVWDSGFSGQEPRWTLLDHPDDWTTPVEVQPVELDGGNTRGYVNRGGNWHPVVLYDSEGRRLWQSSWDPAVNRLAAADLDADGKLDLVVGHNGNGGIARLNQSGQVIWRQPEQNVWAVELADLEGDGQLEILHSRSCGDLVVRDAQGGVLATRRLAEYLSSFSLLQDPRESGSIRLVYAGSNSFRVADPKSGEDEAYTTTLPVKSSSLRGARVRLEAGAPPLLAFLADWRIHPRSALALYDDSGVLRHEEVLPYGCGSLRVETSDAEGDVMVLGCENRVVLFGQPLPVLRRSVALGTAFYGAESGAIAEDLRVMAWHLYQENQSERAEPLARRALAFAERDLTDGAPQKAAFLETLALVLQERGSLAEAESLLLRAIAVAPPEEAWSVHWSLGGLLRESGRLDDAETHYHQALETMPEANSLPLHRTRGWLLRDFARLLDKQGRRSEAARAAESALSHHLRAYGAGHPEVERDEALLSELADDRATEVLNEAASATSAEAGFPPAAIGHPD